MATVGELKARVQRLFGDESLTFLEAADFLAWFNDAQTDVVRRTDCLANEASGNTVAGTNSITVPSDLLKFKQVIFNYMGLREQQAENELLTSQLAPVDTPTGFYLLWNGKIYFNSTQCATSLPYRILYTRKPAVLTNDASVPEIPDQYHEMLVRYALARAKEMEEDFSASDRFTLDYKLRLLELRSDVDNSSSSSYNAVRILDNEW